MSPPPFRMFPLPITRLFPPPCRSFALLAVLAVVAPVRSSAETIPINLLVMGERDAQHALLVDKQADKVFLYESGGEEPPRLLRAWNATTGQNQGDKRVSGDHKTPEGIYDFTEVIEDAKLPAKYGVRALVMSYPNLFDRRQKKTGDGIWLHGTDELVRPLISNLTRGCVVVTNRDMLEISKYVNLYSTPIIVEKRIERTTVDGWRERRREVLGYLERWRAAWASKSDDAYAPFYAESFRAGGKGRASRLGRTRKTVTATERLEIELIDPIVLARRDEVVARFGQLYLSDGVASYGLKRLWLRRDGADWTIVSETWSAAKAPPSIQARLDAWVPVERPKSVQVASEDGLVIEPRRRDGPSRKATPVARRRPAAGPPLRPPPERKRPSRTPTPAPRRASQARPTPTPTSGGGTSGIPIVAVLGPQPGARAVRSGRDARGSDVIRARFITLELMPPDAPRGVAVARATPPPRSAAAPGLRSPVVVATLSPPTEEASYWAPPSPIPSVPVISAKQPNLPGPFVISRFLAEAGAGEVDVRFRLERRQQSLRPRSGSVVVVVRVETDEGDRILIWPWGTRVVGGVPTPPVRGDEYSIRRLKNVHATLSGLPADAILNSVRVHVYDRSGREIVRRSFGG